jgi:hypothetical protein
MTAVAGADKYNQNSWAILYGALAGNLGLSPENFQLIYPNITWDWPVEKLKYIGPAAYNAMSTIPDFSAIGKNTSTGTLFNDKYIKFLNVIDPATSDPVLRGEIERANQALTDATGNYARTMQQAKSDYEDKVPLGDPVFIDWLGTLEGRGWQVDIRTDFEAVTTAQAEYSSKLNQTRSPILKRALAAYEETDYRSKLNNPYHCLLGTITPNEFVSRTHYQ